MSDKIGVGDLAMLVRGHECAYGKVFQVIALHRPKFMGKWICSECGTEGLTTEVCAFEDGDSAVPVSWLRRIPPLTEPAAVCEEEA